MVDINSSAPPAAAASQPSSKKRVREPAKAASKRNPRVFSTNAKVVWNEEMHNLLMTLVGQKKSWEEIALALSAKDWGTSDGGTQKLSFTVKACENRYRQNKGAYNRAHNIHSITSTSSH
jgi:hypothetical protein